MYFHVFEFLICGELGTLSKYQPLSYHVDRSNIFSRFLLFLFDQLQFYGFEIR